MICLRMFEVAGLKHSKKSNFLEMIKKFKCYLNCTEKYIFVLIFNFLKLLLL